MYWNDFDGSFLLGKVFSKPVEISMVDIFGIKIDHDGPTVIIDFDLVDQLPDIPLDKWGKDYNRCRCGINCGGVGSLEIKGLETNIIAEVKIETSRNQVIVNINSSNFMLNMKCSHLQFTGPSVYINQ